MGSLSNIVGRKPLLLTSYMIFASAATVCGAAPTFSIFVIGRVMAGVGGSGMVAMVNLNLSDLVGIVNLASYRSWFQAAMAAGRLCGGPVGGYLAEQLEWRIVFWAQTPVLLGAAGLCAVLIPSTPTPSLPSEVDDTGADEIKGVTSGRPSRVQKMLRQVDVGGSFLLVCTITLGLVSLNFLGDGYTLRDFRVSLTIRLCFVCLVLLVTVERYIVATPMLSRRLLLNPLVVGIYLINILGMFAQSSLTFILPLEDRILHSATADRAGLQLMPLLFGSISGSIAAGALIKKSFNLTKMFSTAMIVTSLARAALYLCWYSTGPITRLLPLVVIGVSSSVTFASTFIFLNAHVSKADQAMAVGCLFCLYGIGSAVGTTSSKLIIDSIFRSSLAGRLSGEALHTPEVMASITGHHHLIPTLPQEAQATIYQSIKDGFSASRGFSLASQVATLPCLLLLRSAPFKISGRFR